jgi:hypothetical protein
MRSTLTVNAAGVSGVARVKERRHDLTAPPTPHGVAPRTSAPVGAAGANAAEISSVKP